MPSACQKVLNTYELLEKILLYLSIHDLFTVHRVSKSWLSLLHRSATLEHAMFLSPSVSPLRPLDSPYNLYAGRTRALYDPAPIRLNPAADTLGLLNEPATRNPIATFGLSDQNLFLQFEIKGLPIYEKRIAHADASWRRMLLTQPPITAVHFEFIKRNVHGGPVTVWNPKGVTFGDLHDWSVRLAEEYEIETGLDPELSFERVSFCLILPPGKAPRRRGRASRVHELIMKLLKNRPP